jgi:hypothetical protein
MSAFTRRQLFGRVGVFGFALRDRHRSSRRWSFGLLAGGAAMAVGVSGTVAVTAPVSAAAAATPRAVAVSGQVLDARVLSTPRGASVVIPNGLHPIAGARVSVAFPSGTTVNTITSRAGRFTVAQPADTPAKTMATVSVHASGFGTWRETGVPAALPRHNFPILTVLLNGVAQAQAYPRNPTITGRAGPPSGAGSPKPARASSARAAPAQNTAGANHNATPASSCSGYSSNTVAPATITVDNVTTDSVQTYSFQTYVEDVLPNEWPSGSPAEAYEAGAVAVKEYGWYFVNTWDGGSLNGECYDVQGGVYPPSVCTGTAEQCCDTNYQCFMPNTETEATNEAFDSTWPSLITRSGAIFETSYMAGPVGAACQSEGGNVMYQNGTVTCADPPSEGGDNYAWPQILTTYYTGIALSVAAGICSYGTSSTACLNRNGGGYTSGTNVIGWDEDSDQNENFYGVLLTGWCNSGYVTETCPFTVGSGLNARYDGDPIFELATSNNQCVGADSSWLEAVLGGCLPDGGAFVGSNANGVFLISVGVSNHFYGTTGSYDAPYWLVWDGNFGDPLIFTDEALNSWTCQPGSSPSMCGQL